MTVLHLTTATLQNSASTEFNGSRVQGAPQGVGDFAFVNHFKGGQGWSGSGAWVDPLTLDDDGWPNTLPVALANRMYVPNPVDRPGEYIVDWDGNGTLSLAGGHASLVSGSLTSTTGSGSFRFSMPDNTNLVDIGIASLTTKITNIRVYHEDDAGIIDTEIFSPLLIEYARNFGVIRFMDVHFIGRSSGQGNLTTWNMRKPPTYAIWGGSERRGSITYAPSYALNGSSNDYSKTYTDGHGSSAAGPYDKETIILKVGNSATNTTCTFNKNGTGALPIIDKTGAALTTNQRPQTGLYATLIYDAAFNSWTQWGGNFNNEVFYLLNGWPVEVFMELCKLAGAHPLITFCHTMFDPISDYPTEFATYIKENYQDTDCPWMVPRFEPVNELWNNQFTQTAYADNRQVIRNGSTTVLTVTAFTTPGSTGAGSSDLTVTGGSVYPVGACIFLGGTWGTLSPSFVNDTVYITAVNVGGNPNKFTINQAPSSGSWAAGGTTQGQANDRHNWYGRAMSELGQAIAGVYGVAKANVKTQPYYETIACVQTAATPAAVNDRVVSTQYVLLGGDAAKDWTTMVGIAQYVSTANRGKPTELGMAWLYNQGDLTQGDLYADETIGSSAITATIPNLDTALYPAWKTWAQGHSVQRMCGYEGGYSPDYKQVGTTVSCTITGATKAADCILTVSNGSVEPGWVAAATNSNGCFDNNCVGMTFTISGVTGMTQLNGLTATIVSVSGNQVTVDIDSTAFSTYVSGGTALVTDGRLLINTLRYAGKKSLNLKAHTKTNLQNFVDHSGGGFSAVFPSGFIWTGSSYPVNLNTAQIVGGGTVDTQIWSVRDPDIYADTDPQSLAIEEFNAEGLIRLSATANKRRA